MPLNILIADDDAVSCALAGALLQRLGLPRPRIARDAASLSDAPKDAELDVVLIDMRLPGLHAQSLVSLSKDHEDPCAAPPVWVELIETAATPSQPLALRKPLQRDAVQAVLEALDHHAETWADLLRLFGPVGAGEMLDALKRDLRVQREMLARSPADCAQLRGIAHRLRGAALQLGANNLASHCARTEQLADTDAAQTESRLLRVLGRFETLVRYLERQLES